MELKINEKCIGCGACVADCPVGALALNGVSTADCVSAENLPLPSAEQMRGLLMGRRSVRQFAPEDLPRDRIVEIKRKNRIGKVIEEEVQQKLERLKLPRNQSVKLVLVYNGELDPTVEADGYFDYIIPVEQLLRP